MIASRQPTIAATAAAKTTKVNAQATIRREGPARRAEAAASRSIAVTFGRNAAISGSAPDLPRSADRSGPTTGPVG